MTVEGLAASLEAEIRVNYVWPIVGRSQCTELMRDTAKIAIAALVKIGADFDNDVERT